MKVLKFIFSLFLITLFLTGCTNVKDKSTLKVIPTATPLPSVEEILDGFVPSTTNQIAVVNTTKGVIKIELYNEDMPITAGNFEKLIKDKYFDGIIFHRVIPEFMIQGGDPTGTGTGGPGYNIPDENVGAFSNLTGTISMANAGPNTGGSQFFINVADNTFLDTKHPVFGKVIEGMDIVMSISNANRDASDKPTEEIKINSVTIQ